jgi:hypothetical protein
MITAVCTLFEGHYHLGAAALINSLWASGFRGRVICGLRGALPPWARPTRQEAGGFQVQDLGDGFEIWFVTLTTAVHFTNYKPTFMLEMWKGPAAGAERFYYLDPDIVVKCPWDVVERWAEDGIACCEDVNYYLPTRHPLRLGWEKWLAQRGVSTVRPDLNRYYSGGFIGLPKENREFLQSWADLIAQVGEATGSLSKLKQGTANSLFHSSDQDALNIAFMTSTVTINSAGWEAMDFTHGGHLLSHAIGGRKPWRGGFVGQALQGYPPSLAAKAFLEYIDGPIEMFSSREKSKLRRSLRVAALIGRFYRRA